MGRGAITERLPAGAARELVARLGAHPAAALRIDLDREAGRRGWLVAACLLSGRGGEAHAGEAHAALARAGLEDLTALASADPGEVALVLERTGIAAAEALAARLVRAGRALVARHAGSLETLAREALDLEELAARIAKLAPGIGASTVARFLRPLRDRWPAAREVPLAPAARAAARDLGWLGEAEDEEGEPAVLRAALAGDPTSPALADVEAALERLGAAACLRGRTARCPLAASCPRRAQCPPDRC